MSPSSLLFFTAKGQKNGDDVVVRKGKRCNCHLNSRVKKNKKSRFAYWSHEKTEKVPNKKRVVIYRWKNSWKILKPSLLFFPRKSQKRPFDLFRPILPFFSFPQNGSRSRTFEAAPNQSVPSEITWYNLPWEIRITPGGSKKGDPNGDLNKKIRKIHDSAETKQKQSRDIECWFGWFFGGGGCRKRNVNMNLMVEEQLRQQKKWASSISSSWYWQT